VFASAYTARVPIPRQKQLPMDQTLHSLGNLLIEAVPTILFFIFLTIYLKAVFFKPMAKILEERRRATEGVRELAQKAFEAAEKKGTEFEHALQIARAQLHQEHESLRRRWSEEQAAQLAQARAEADKKIQEARREIGEEVERAQAQLNLQVESLSERITNSLLRRRAA
jgi:F-type H+-transporting ATPase subunit b